MEGVVASEVEVEVVIGLDSCLTFEESLGGKLYDAALNGRCGTFDTLLNAQVKLQQQQQQQNNNKKVTPGMILDEVFEKSHTSCLYAACSRGHFGIVKRIAEFRGEVFSFEEIANGNRFSQQSCLNVAGQRGHFQIMKYILAHAPECKVVLEISNPGSDTVNEDEARRIRWQNLLNSALLTAAQYDQVDCVRVLLSFGASLKDNLDPMGHRSPIQLAKECNSRKVVKFLSPRTEYTPLMFACEYCDEDCVRFLVKSLRIQEDRTENENNDNNNNNSCISFEKEKLLGLLRNSEEKKSKLGEYRSILTLFEKIPSSQSIELNQNNEQQQMEKGQLVRVS